MKAYGMNRSPCHGHCGREHMAPSRGKVVGSPRCRPGCRWGGDAVKQAAKRAERQNARRRIASDALDGAARAS
jgi:hypothetical protein